MPEFQAFEKIPRLSRNCVITEKIDGCLHSSTKIMMSDNTLKEIRRIEVGDEVLGMNSDGLLSPSIVTHTYKDPYPEKNWKRISVNRFGAGKGNFYSAVKCTPNHKFFNPDSNNYVAADDLKIGDSVYVARFNYELTPLQKSVLLGILLGDGTLATANSGNMAVEYAHTNDQLNYTNYCHKALGNISNPNTFTRISGYGSQMTGARTITSFMIAEEFSSFKNENGIKCVPEWVVEKLDPIALAFWYMDDGSLTHHDDQEDRANFSTYAFTQQDNEVLLLALKKFNINGVLQFTKKGIFIRLNADEAEKLFLLIAPYVTSSMQYKLPERYRGSPEWIPALSEAVYKPHFVKCHVTNIEEYVPWTWKSTKYDLTTTTSNFFAGHILVHNSNAAVVIEADDPYKAYAQSRSRFITPEDDNYNFARWVSDNEEDLTIYLGPGYHYGEWWGSGINRGYGLQKGEKRFSLFNTGRWRDSNEEVSDPNDKRQTAPKCCSVVPILYNGVFNEDAVQGALISLMNNGSAASRGFMKPEGIIIYHEAAKQYFKKTIEKDEAPKGKDG